MHIICYLKNNFATLCCFTVQVNGQQTTTAPPDDTCVANQTTATHEAVILNQIYSGELVINASENTPIRCEDDGPLMVKLIESYHRSGNLFLSDN